jgi:NAD+ kinase
MSFRAGSTRPLASAVRRAAVVTHGRPELLDGALERLETVARDCDVELLLSAEEAAKHGREGVAASDVDLTVVLGGDGTMLRALKQFLGTGTPVLGVNFGRVGFLASIAADELEEGLTRAFRGDYRIFELPTLEAEVDGRQRTAVNDVVAHGSALGRMVNLAWTVDGEDLGTVRCDGLVSCTPSGSTAYNLSSGGPLLSWGLDAMAITFIAPHSLHARPLVVPRGAELVVFNRTPAVSVTVLVDGHAVAEIASNQALRVWLGEEKSLLATLPDRAFVRRYKETFAS